MNATPAITTQPIEIDGEDRLNARRLAAARVLIALVQSLKADYGEGASSFYEAHLSLGLGTALVELAEGGLLPQLQVLLDAALPGMVEEFFQRAEAVMEAAGAVQQS